MIEMMRPILEIAVIIPGMLLAYLSVRPALDRLRLNLCCGCFLCFLESVCQAVLFVIFFRLLPD